MIRGDVRCFGGRRRGWIAATVALASTALALGVGRPSPAQDTERAGDALAARGEYLVAVGGCEGCHDGSAGRLAGGRAFKSSFGVIRAANITPDSATGIGDWSADDFYRAVHDGHSRKVGHLYPAFPYPHFTKVTRSDADAIYAYLRTVSPVANTPHRNELEFPFSIRAINALWNTLFFHKGEYRPNEAESEDWNRGAYLVLGLAHCGDCHTPKNGLQAERDSRFLQGGMVEGWFAPNLTSEPRTGLGGWSEADIVAFLAQGRNRVTAAGGPMAGVVADSTSKMSKADQRAMAIYLKSLPASESPTPSPPDVKTMDRGERIYAARCAGCHAEAGGGGRHGAPPLAGSALAQAENPASAVRYVLGGARGPVTAAYPHPEGMPRFADKLDDSEIADVVTYIRNAWGNRGTTLRPSQVAKLRAVAQASRQQGGAKQSMLATPQRDVGQRLG